MEAGWVGEPLGVGTGHATRAVWQGPGGAPKVVSQRPPEAEPGKDSLLRHRQALWVLQAAMPAPLQLLSSTWRSWSHALSPLLTTATGIMTFRTLFWPWSQQVDHSYIDMSVSALLYEEMMHSVFKIIFSAFCWEKKRCVMWLQIQSLSYPFWVTDVIYSDWMLSERLHNIDPLFGIFGYVGYRSFSWCTQS